MKCGHAKCGQENMVRREDIKPGKKVPGGCQSPVSEVMPTKKIPKEQWWIDCLQIPRETYPSLPSNLLFSSDALAPLPLLPFILPSHLICHQRLLFEVISQGQVMKGCMLIK
jgi:hypothetical protein